MTSATQLPEALAEGRESIQHYLQFYKVLVEIGELVISWDHLDRMWAALTGSDDGLACASRPTPCSLSSLLPHTRSVAHVRWSHFVASFSVCPCLCHPRGFMHQRSSRRAVLSRHAVYRAHGYHALDLMQCHSRRAVMACVLANRPGVAGATLSPLVVVLAPMRREHRC